MLEFSRFVFPEGGKGISFIVLSPASSIDLAPFGLGMNVCQINEWVRCACEAVRWGTSLLGLG